MNVMPAKVAGVRKIINCECIIEGKTNVKISDEEKQALEKYPNLKDTYIDENGSTVTTMLETWEVKYGTVYNGPITNFLYRDSSKLNDEERYGF